MTEASFDAVIVGAGHNALAAALHLCVKDWSVGVFERADHVGGCIATSELVASGYRSDHAAMNLSLFAGSAFHQAYGRELASHGLTFVPIDKPFASAFPDRSWLGVSTDAEATAQRIAALSPADADRWREMAAAFHTEATHIGGLLGTPMTGKALLRYLWKTWRARGLPWMIDTARFLALSPRAWLDQEFESERLKAMMAAWGMHLDFAPDISGGAVFPYLECMASQAFGMMIGQGGADTVSNALRKAVNARGGAIETGADVTRITRRAGRATGVTLKDGRHISATRAVIAGTTPAALVALTGGTEDARYDRMAGKFAHAPGTMMIHLALDALPDWAAGTELQDYAYVHLAPSLAQMAQTYVDAKAGLLPAEPVLVVGQPTVYDPSRAPAGKHVLWVQVRMAPSQIRGDAKGEITATDWTQARTPFAARALDILERYAPGTQARITAQYVVSPADLEAWNPNLVGGDQIAGSHHIAQNFLFRPMRGFSDWSTPVKNLHLTGASTWPGAGTGAGSGYMLAQSLAGH